jgi:aminopeptidase N
MVLKMLENYLGDAVMRKGLQSYLADYALGDCFVRQTGVPLVSLDTQCDLTANQTVVSLKQSPYPNQNLYPGIQWTIPLTLAYGEGLARRKTVAMKDTQMQVRLNGCSGVVADPSGLDCYVTNYGDNAWSQLLAQSSALTDPVLLTNLQLEAKMLVNSGLADPSRATGIGSITPPASAMARRQLLVAPQEQQPRPILRYQGKLKPRNKTE